MYEIKIQDLNVAYDIDRFLQHDCHMPPSKIKWSFQPIKDSMRGPQVDIVYKLYSLDCDWNLWFNAINSVFKKSIETKGNENHSYSVGSVNAGYVIFIYTVHFSKEV